MTPQRIVSLLPSATEILFAIGAGDRVVAVTHECDYPAAATRLPALTASALPAAGSPADIDRHVRSNLHAGSSLYALDAAALERLAPDLIVTQELCEVCAVSYEIVAHAARRLRGDPRIVSLEPSSLDDVLATIEYLGELTGTRDGAAAVVAQMRERFARLRSRAGTSARRPRTLLLEWTDPPMSAGHWIPELLEIAGGEPVLANPSVNSARLEWDAIARCDPDTVLVAPCGFDAQRSYEAMRALDRVPQWLALRARVQGRVHALDGNAYFSRPGPRLVESAQLAAAAIAGTAASE